MMYAKLALENVKKSTKDYLIYIVTLTACISMFYAFLSISSNYYDPNIGAEFNLDILGDGIKYAILLITVLLMFLMQYVNHFMIQRRKREFAIQSIIGMEQSTIARLFFVESLIMGIISLIVPVTDYSFLDSFIEKNISVRDDCSFKTYFVNKTDFYNQLENSRKNASPITAISLSDYNHLLKMAGYDEISLRDHEFTTQWLSITPQDSISEYLEAHKSIKTDGGDLQLADISAHTVDLGEDFYNFQSVIYIVPDHICNKLTSANTFRYMMADKTISYDIAQELKSYFENSSLTDSLVTYNITMRTIEVNDNSAVIFIMQTGLTYSAIILFVTCFTILALQQLSDSGKYKYRFRVLRNMGVEEPHIRKLILKQLAVWFGVPVILALILSGAFLVFLFVGFHMQIAVYIGVQRLVQQLLIVLAILDVLLISYFISTWVLFNKSASA